MKRDIKLELQEIKYLFGYERGRVISEQIKPVEEYDVDMDNRTPEEKEMDYTDLDMDNRTPEEKEMDYTDLDMDNRTPEEKEMDWRDIDMEIHEDLDVPVMLPGTKEKERTITTPGIKPGTKPRTPYRPKPGPKKNPKAKKGEMPDWLTFDELGIDFE